MEKKYNIFGESLSQENKEKAVRTLKGWKREYSKPLEGELEKTSDDIGFIEAVSNYVNNLFEQLGLEKSDIAPSQIHFLSKGVFERNFPKDTHRGVRGIHKSSRQAIYIDKQSCFSKEEYYFITLHEVIHLLSHSKYFMDTKKRRLLNIRSGYTVKPLADRSVKRLGRFNEAVVDQITLDAFRTGRTILEKKFNFDFRGTIHKGYVMEKKILAAIIEGVSKTNGEDVATIWQKIMRGLFTGEMMHLRDVDRVFGRGSLRVLAVLDYFPSRFSLKEVQEKVLAYFQADDRGLREGIRDELLST